MIRKPTWESSPTIPAPPLDEIDVEVESEPVRPSVTIVDDSGPPGAPANDSARQLREDIAGLRSDVRVLSDLVRGVARSNNRNSDQNLRIANAVQILLNDHDKRNGLNGINVLIVEDDEDLAESEARRLIRAGAAPIVATSKAHALEQLERFGDAFFRVAIVDVLLPDGNGMDLAKRLRRSGVAVIGMTGAGDDSVPPEVFHWVLGKPYTGADLRAAIRLVIDRTE
jgi:CheY-like chemotaxis protein